MSNENRSVPAAQYLLAEHQANKTFGSIPSEFVPRTLAEAYAMQDALQSLMAATHGPVAEYKTALTTPVMQKVVGFTEPAVGAILGKTIYQSPYTLRSADYGHLGIECEIAVRLGADLPLAQAPFSRDQVVDAIESLMVAFELIDDRHADYAQLTVQVLSAIADNAWNAGVILGSPVLAWSEIDLAAAHGTLFINGALAGEGHGRDVMGHPLDALMWLANTLAQRGKPLTQGMVVMTGSIISTKFLHPGDSARFGVKGLGEVSSERSLVSVWHPPIGALRIL